MKLMLSCISRNSKTYHNRFRNHSKMKPHKTRNFLSPLSPSLTQCHKTCILPPASLRLQFQYSLSGVIKRQQGNDIRLKILNYKQHESSHGMVLINYTYNNTQKESVLPFYLWIQNEYDFYML